MSSLLYLALSNAILATVLAAVVAVVAHFCRRPVVRHALWLLVLLKLVTPPLLPLSVTWPQGEESEPPSLETPPAPVLLAPDPEPSESIPPFPEVPGERGRVSAPRDVLGALTRPRSPSDPPNLVDFWMLAVIAIWLGGSLVWWSIAAVRLRKFQRVLRRAEPAPADVQEQGRRLAALLGLRRCPPIVFISAPLSPMLWALGLSPRLLLPAALWRKLTAEQQDTLLAHELAHLRRGDHWVRRLEFVVLGLYWWHPVVWWARRQLQQAEEECCDAVVIAVLPDAAPDYASALLETVAFLSQARAALLIGASGVGQVPLLKRRLTMILSETSSRKPSRIAFWAVLGAGALLLPLAPQAARTQAPEKPKREEPKDHTVANKQIGLSRTVTTSAETAPSNPPSGDKGDRQEEIEKLQDEIELFKVQVRIKEVRIEATKRTLKEYQRRKENYVRANRLAPGAIPTDTLAEIQLTITTQEGQIQIYEAELQESHLRLKQAQRRLARLRASKPRGEHAVPLKPEEYRVQLGPQFSSWNVNWAEALFDQRTRDLGSQQHGAIVETKFAMTNHGQRPVHITGIRTSAGCLKAKIIGNELAPGGSGAVRAQLDTSKFSGSKTFQIYVEFDKPDRQEVVLEIRADSRTAGAAKPQSPERLQELEKKLDDLRKEMEALRREMRPDKPH